MCPLIRDSSLSLIIETTLVIESDILCWMLTTTYNSCPEQIKSPLFG